MTFANFLRFFICFKNIFIFNYITKKFRISDLVEKMTTFAKLLRNSKFMQLGDFQNRFLTGKIVHRVGEDLYVDLGLKFNAVCKPPMKRDPTE